MRWDASQRHSFDLPVTPDAVRLSVPAGTAKWGYWKVRYSRRLGHRRSMRTYFSFLLSIALELHNSYRRLPSSTKFRVVLTNDARAAGGTCTRYDSSQWRRLVASTCSSRTNEVIAAPRSPARASSPATGSCHGRNTGWVSDGRMHDVNFSVLLCTGSATSCVSVTPSGGRITACSVVPANHCCAVCGWLVVNVTSLQAWICRVGPTPRLYWTTRTCW